MPAERIDGEEGLVALMVDLQRGVLDPEVLVQFVFECAAGGVAVGVRIDEDVR